MLAIAVNRFPTQLQTHPGGELFMCRLEVDGIDTQCRLCVSPADRERWPGHAPEKLIEESLRFLAARVPLTSLLGCFDLTLLATQFPEYLPHMAQRFGDNR
jgi:hypothetical protein